MNNPELLVVLTIGAVLMCIPISVQMKWYQIKTWKSVIISVMLVLTGLVGSEFWYFVENGIFGGRSFYGVVFIVPFVFFPVAKVLRIPYGLTLDFCAPAGCLTLAMVKIQCLRDGCCDGIALYLDENYNYVKFPSQILEMIIFCVIGFVLMKISSNRKNQKKVFPYFMVLYGATRFVLNFFRDGITPYVMGLSAGSFWSLLAFVIGFIILMVQKYCVGKD